MIRFRFTPQAPEDLSEIWGHFAIDNPEAADQVESAIYDACTLVGNSPFGGHFRKDLTNRPLRFWTLPRYPNYLIVYDPKTKPVEVIRILHGRRDVKSILRVL